MNPPQLIATLEQATKELEEAQGELERAVKAWAEADREYRLARARAFIATSGTVAEREAHTDLETDEQRYRAHLADGLKVSALEAVRNRRQQLSAWQSAAALMKSEAELAKYGPPGAAA